MAGDDMVWIRDHSDTRKCVEITERGRGGKGEREGGGGGREGERGRKRERAGVQSV